MDTRSCAGVYLHSERVTEMRVVSFRFKDIWVRGVTALVLLGCGAYFAFGVAAGAAAYRPGTAIQHYEAVSWAMLWREVSRVSFPDLVRWVSLFDGCGSWLLIALALWFSAALLAAFAMAVKPRLFLRSRARIGATVLIGLGSLFGGYGLFNLLFTLLNAFVGRGLDGEWVIEFGPMLDAVGILYLTACLLLLRSWFPPNPGTQARLLPERRGAGRGIASTPPPPPAAGSRAGRKRPPKAERPGWPAAGSSRRSPARTR
jgi:hypothetical protein